METVIRPQIIAAESERRYLSAIKDAARTTAKTEEEKQIARWIGLAVSTLPDPNLDSALVIDVHGHLIGARREAGLASKVENDLLAAKYTDRVNAISDDLRSKVNETQASLNTHLRPRIEKLKIRLMEEITAIQKEVNKTIDDIQNDKKKIERLQKDLALNQFFSVLEKMLSVFGGLVSVLFPEGGEIASGIIEYGANELTEETNKKITAIEQEISGLQDQIKDSEKLAETLKFIVPLVEASVRLMQKLRDARGVIGVIEWMTSEEMTDFKLQLITLPAHNIEVATSGRNLGDFLTETGHYLYEVMNRAEWYRNQLNVVSLLNGTTPGQVLPESALSLKQIFNQNVLVSTYRMVKKSLQIYSFPFCSLVAYSDIDRCMTGRDNNLAECADEYYSRLLSRIETQSTVPSGNNMRTCSKFDIIPDADAAFYSWPNAEYQEQIADLLAGNEVLLHADVHQKAHLGRYVVKFNQIGLKFWHGSGAEHAELRDALKAFEISMRHMGNSYFDRCGKDVVFFSHRTLTIKYSFAKDGSGQPDTEGGDSKLLRTGDTVVSPYGSWAVRLRLRPEYTRVNFTALQRFTSQVSMSLVGSGSYVDEGAKCEDCDWDLRISDR